MEEQLEPVKMMVPGVAQAYIIQANKLALYVTVIQVSCRSCAMPKPLENPRARENSNT